MKVVKVILIALVIIIAIPLIVALFVGSDFKVEREITIGKPKQAVFDYIKFVKNQDNFSKWNKLDPGMKKDYKGTDGTVGFVASWESNNKKVGKGEQEITKITDGERLDSELRFEKPMHIKDNAYFITEAVGDNQTKVKWGFYGKMPYPFNIMSLFMNLNPFVSSPLIRR